MPRSKQRSGPHPSWSVLCTAGSLCGPPNAAENFPAPGQQNHDHNGS